MTAPVVDAQPYADVIKVALTGQGISHAEGRKPTVAAGVPYIVWWLNAGRVTNRSLKSRDGFELVVTFECYGGNPDAVRFAVRKGRVAVSSLFGHVIGGRTVLMPVHVASPDMARDDDLQPPLWWQTDEWRIRTS